MSGAINFTFARALGGAAFAEVGPIVTKHLRRAAPGRGNWIHTITHRVGATNIRWVGTTKPWGFVTRGTKPHEILPKHASVLRFEVGGKIVFARKVNHPGTKPNRFQFKAWKDALPETRPLLKMAVQAGIQIRQANPYRITL